MKTYEVKYRRFSHPSWVCTEHVIAASKDEALKEASRRLTLACGKRAFSILCVEAFG